MADSPVFEFVSEFLEGATSLDRLESKGTVRLALKQAGLEARSVTADQMVVVLEKIMSHELATRGVADVEPLLDRLGSQLNSRNFDTESDSPEAVFARLGG